MPARIRQLVTRSIELALVHGGVADLRNRVVSESARVLAYHNVVPEGCEPAGDLSLHLPLADFRRQLDQLQRTHEIVPLAALLDNARRRGRPRAAITFDDAYAGALRCAVPELARRGLPATIFVAPGILGGTAPWWDTVGPPPGVSTDAFRDYALDDLAGDGAAIRGWALAHGGEERHAPEHARIASLEEVGAASARGMTIGPHSWSHRNLARLAESTLADELAWPLAWLRARFSDVLPVLAYPYGLTSAAVERAAERFGYAAAFCVSGGALPRRGPAYRLPRQNVPAGLTPERFRLRTAGVLD